MIGLIAALLFPIGRWLSNLRRRAPNDERRIAAPPAEERLSLWQRLRGQKAVRDDNPRPTTNSPRAVDELGSLNGPAGLSYMGQRCLRFIASERLWEHHGLNVDYFGHREKIQQTLSPELWAALDYRLQVVTPDQQGPQLQRLLIEIEQL